MEVSDEELVDKLVDDMSAIELRKWMRQRGMTRSRGISVKQSARQAVEQDKDQVKEYFGLNQPEFSVHCMCGFEEWFDDKVEAINVAKKHAISSEDCAPKAWSSRGPCIYR